MIGIDTNLLLRLLLDDDATQVRRMRQELARAEAAGEKLYVNDVVLAEAVWTLRSRYDASKAEVVQALRDLIDNARLMFENRPVLIDAVDHFEKSRAGFADCLILAKNAEAGCACTFTFDRALRPFAHARIL